MKKISIIKVFVIYLCVFCSLIPVFGMTLEGGVEYTEELVREEAFRNVKQYRSLDNTLRYFLNLSICDEIQSIQKINVSYFKLFGVTRYGVRFKNEPSIIYYYNMYTPDLYFLAEYELLEGKEGEYPRKAIKYTKDGHLLGVVFRIKEQEEYVFDKDKNLLAHWINDKGYLTQKGGKGKRNFIYITE